VEKFIGHHPVALFVGTNDGNRDESALQILKQDFDERWIGASAGLLASLLTNVQGVLDIDHVPNSEDVHHAVSIRAYDRNTPLGRFLLLPQVYVARLRAMPSRLLTLAAARVTHWDGARAREAADGQGLAGDRQSGQCGPFAGRAAVLDVAGWDEDCIDIAGPQIGPRNFLLRSYRELLFETVLQQQYN
jgi:hypothetical protein